MWTAADTVRVINTHNESVAGAISYTFPTTPGLKILSVAFNGSGTGALTVGASITNSANGTAFNLVSGYAYVYGMSFVGASGISNSNTVNVHSTGGTSGMHFESCTFSAPGTGTTARVTFGPASSNNDAEMELVNCTVSNGADKSIQLRNAKIFMQGLALAGTAPTTVFLLANIDGGEFDLVASDISNLAWTNLVSVTASVTAGYFKAVQCKLRASFTVTTGTFAGPGAPYVEIIDCNSGDVNNYYSKHMWEGTITSDSAVYEAATDGVSAMSFKMVSSANSSYIHPLKLPCISYFNTALAATTTTVEVVSDNVTFKDNELWQETLAKITSGSPVGTVNSADKSSIVAAGASQDTSTVTWTGTGGFGVVVKQKLVSGSFTPAEVGRIVTSVKLAKASSTVYVSPKILSTSGIQTMLYSGEYVNGAATAAAGGGGPGTTRGVGFTSGGFG